MTDVFNLTIPHLREWSRRQLPDHRQLNEPVDTLNRMTTGIARPHMKAGGPVGGAPASAVAQFKLTLGAAAFPDHLVCRTWDGETQGGEDVLVAKPWLLRRTPFDRGSHGSVNYIYANPTERSASIGPDSEAQIIVPRYLLGDILYATNRIVGGTSVVYGPDEDPPLPPMVITWLDLNCDGRAWAAVAFQS